jgi:predicted metalloprotease with PDZ domain
VDTAVTQAGGGPGGGGAEWINWRRSSDYYPEGDLIWLEAATVIARQTNGRKSIDDFCHVFHGGPNHGPEVKTYSVDSLEKTLNDVAPYDWVGFFRARVDEIAPAMPDGGIRNAGWKVEFTDHPTHLSGRHNTPAALYSLGLQLREDGTVSDSIVGSPAYEAGISPGMKVVGVNGHLYTRDVLEDGIKASKDSTGPIAILVINYDYYRTCNVNYHGEERFPHLARDESKGDYLTGLAKARVPQQ